MSKDHQTVVRLGNPMVTDGQRGRALNVWDLQVFEGKVYVGGGDTSTNKGPMNVWAYNPASQLFIKETTIPEEAILRFKLIDDQLYIPAADPRNADSSKFYRKAIADDWQQFGDRQHKLAHVRDLIKVDQSLLLVGNSRPPTQGKKATPGAVVTNDQGASFNPVIVNNLPDTGEVRFIGFDWFFTVFNYQNKIYALNSLLRDAGNYPGFIAVYDSDIQELSLDFSLTNNEFIPQQNIDFENGKHGVNTIYQIWQPIEYQGDLIYTARSFSNTISLQAARKLYFNSLGLYLKSDIGKSPKEVRLPHQAIGEDLLLIEDELYVLANKKNAPEKFTIYVFKTSQPQNQQAWEQIVSFESTNKARSFEYLDRTFYFGLGQDAGEAIANSGDILSYTLP